MTLAYSDTLLLSRGCHCKRGGLQYHLTCLTVPVARRQRRRHRDAERVGGTAAAAAHGAAVAAVVPLAPVARRTSVVDRVVDRPAVGAAAAAVGRQSATASTVMVKEPFGLGLLAKFIHEIGIYTAARLIVPRIMVQVVAGPCILVLFLIGKTA